jgi:uncharacterized membrane-anchored protein
VLLADAPPLPRDDPGRRALHDEVHARPPVALVAPAHIAHVALRVPPQEREREPALMRELVERLGLPVPERIGDYLLVEAGPLRVKWERHTEFSGLTFFLAVEASGEGTTAGEVLQALPDGWLAAWPGDTIVALRVSLTRGAAPDHAAVMASFGDVGVVGSRCSDGAATALTDFRLGQDGFLDIAVVDHHLTPRQAGRLVQRLIEIETYRMMALLGLPVAKAVGGVLSEAEKRLAAITDRLASHAARDEGALLDDLTSLAAEVERSEARSRFRFGASAAYHQLVRRRIAELREARLPGVQTFEEFLGRRLAPAMATCESVGRRQHELSERIARASQLLRTRVEVALERQNQSLLESMNRRVKLQLALQRTVEGFSIAAITYYVAGLAGYLAKGAGSFGFRVSAELAAAATVPVTALLLWLALRRLRRRTDLD